MSKVKKIAYLATFLTIGGLAAFGFQNCSKVSYQEQDGNNGSNGAGVRKVTINPTFGSQNADLKVLIVADDSYTMSNSQTRLSNAVDSLMNPLAGRNVEFKIVSTSGIPNNMIDYSIDSRYYTQNGTEVAASSVNTLSKYYIDHTVSNLNERHTPLVSYKDYTSEQFEAVKTKVKKAILSVGVNGSDTEEGFCSALRQLFDEGPKRFFKAGDKAAIVFLTDENDSSTYQSCVSKYREVVSNSPVVYYTYAQQKAKLKLEYRAVTDGIENWIPVEWAVGIPQSAYFVNGSACNVDDRNKAVQKVTALGYTIRSVTSCVYDAHMTTHYGADLGDDGSNPNQNVCTSTVVYQGSTYDNLYAFVSASGLAAVSGSCQKVTQPANSITRTDDMTSVIASDATSNNMQDLKNAIVTKSKDLFGSGFIIGSIIRKSNESCDLQTAQSYGVKYEELAASLPNNSVTESMCASNFSSVLSQVSQFIVDTANQSYVVPGMTSNEEVKSVSLVRSGTAQVLAASQYEAVGSTITLNGVNLKSGDVLEVVVGPK